MNTVSIEDMNYYASQSVANMNMMIAGMLNLMNNTEAKVSAMESQGWFQRMVKTVTGKNKATVKEIEQNHDKLNEYMSMTITELYNQNCIDKNVILSLGNQINEVYADHIQLKNMLGTFAAKLNEKIDSVDNFHMLETEIEQGVFNEEKNIISICHVLSQLDNRILGDTRKLDIIKRSMISQNIVNEENVLLADYLKDILSVSEEKAGMIFMELGSIKDDIIANVMMGTMELYCFLPDMNKRLINKTKLVDEVIEGMGLDNTVEITTNDIFDNFINSKISVKEKYCAIESSQKQERAAIQKNSEHDETKAVDISTAEELFLKCKLDEAFEQFEILANAGNTRAMYYLGEYYIQQYGHIKCDYEEGKKWRKKGYENGDVLASINYAYSIEEENEANGIFKKFYKPLLDLAESGDVIAQSELADLYILGNGIEENISEGIKWLKLSSEKGYWRSMYKLASLYLDDDIEIKDDETAIELLTKASEMGFSWSTFRLGRLYEEGDVLPRDSQKAISLYKKASDLGCINATVVLAYIYYNGEEVEEDCKKAYKLAKKAADLGDADGMTLLGIMYSFGRGVDEDEEKSKKYYKKAYKLGDPIAAYALGIICSNEADYEEAVKYYMFSAGKNHVESMVELGHLFEKGRGVDQSYDNARRWMEKAAEHGSSEAAEWIEETFDKKGVIKLEKRVELLCKQFLYSHLATIDHYRPSEKQLNIFGIHHEEVFIAHDDTVFQNGKNGFVITEKGIYDRGMFESVTSYHSFKELSKGKNLTGENEIYLDGVRIAYMTTPRMDIEDLKDLLIDIINTCKEYY